MENFSSPTDFVLRSFRIFKGGTNRDIKIKKLVASFEYVESLVSPFVVQDPESTAYASLTEVTSPTELSHLNLNRILSLAIVDYLRAMTAEREGDLEQKEYYMRHFHKKVSNNESNKNKIYVAQSTSYAVK